MKIWYISKYLDVPSDSSRGGRGFKLMSELALTGVQVTILTSTSNHLNFVPSVTKTFTSVEQNGLSIVWIKTLKFTAARSLIRVISWIDFELKVITLTLFANCRPDFAVISSPSILSILSGVFLKYRYGVKLVFEVRDIWPLTLLEEGGMSPYNPFVFVLGLIEKVGYRMADTIIGTMPGLGKHVEKVLGKPKRTICIPMGVDLKEMQPSENLPLNFSETYVPKGKFLVLYAGTIGITNALQTLFQAAEKLQDKTSIHFLIVGEGGQLPNFKKQHGNLKNLSFLPAVSRLSVGHLVALSDVCYFATFHSKVWNYGQSLAKIVEYMKGAKPIIGSYSGLQSMINEAKCGVCVPAEDCQALVDAILLLSNMELEQRKKMGERGRVWLEKNRSYKLLAQEYLDAITCGCHK